MSKYICELCNKEFKYPSLLNAHKNRKSSCVTGEAKNNNDVNVNNVLPKSNKLPNHDAYIESENESDDDDYGDNNSTTTTQNEGTFDAKKFEETMREAFGPAGHMTTNPDDILEETIITNVTDTILDIYVAPLAHTHKYFIDFTNINPFDTKYIVKKDGEIMDKYGTQDVMFARAIIFITDPNELSEYLGSILIKHCIESHDRKYIDIYNGPPMKPYSEFGIMVGTLQQLIILLYYYDTYDDKDKVTEVLVMQYIEMVRQFMYAYVIKYMAPNRVDIHTVIQYYDLLRILNDKDIPQNLYKQIQPHLLKHKDKIIKNMFEY